MSGGANVWRHDPEMFWNRRYLETKRDLINWREMAAALYLLLDESGYRPEDYLCDQVMKQFEELAAHSDG